MWKWISVLLLTILVLTGMNAAQEGEGDDSDTTARSISYVVTTEAEDGLILVADYFHMADGRPTVLLLHQLYTTRRSWQPLIQPLLDAGYNILNVDVRGYGDTGGRINWTQAVADVQTWLHWLRAQPGVDGGHISLIGSSMGSTLALVGCGNDPACRTAIAISPGWNYYRITVESTFTEGLQGRAVLLVYSERDRWPALGVPQMLDVATGAVDVQTYPGNAHGMTLFRNEGETLIPRIIEWLNAYGR